MELTSVFNVQPVGGTPVRVETTQEVGFLQTLGVGIAAGAGVAVGVYVASKVLRKIDEAQMQTLKEDIEQAQQARMAEEARMAGEEGGTSV